MEFNIYNIEVNYSQTTVSQDYPCVIATGVVHSRTRYCTLYVQGDQIFFYAPLNSLSILTHEDLTLYQLPEAYLLPKPTEISSEKFINSLKVTFSSLNALHYSLSVLQNDSIFIINPPDPTPIHISSTLGLNVFYYSKEEFKSKGVRVLNFPDHLLGETGGLGVNSILDFSETHSNTTKKATIDCLAIRGKWGIKNQHFQLDPPESLSLFMRNASLCFFNEDSWPFNGSDHSKFLHLLTSCLRYIK